jgi:hypothetical protein
MNKLLQCKPVAHFYAIIMIPFDKQNHLTIVLLLSRYFITCVLLFKAPGLFYSLPPGCFLPACYFNKHLVNSSIPVK